MNKPAAFLLMTIVIINTACSKETPVATSANDAEYPGLENIGIKAKTAKSTDDVETAPVVKADDIIIDYEDFPKDKSGQVIWQGKVKTGQSAVSVVKDEELKAAVLNLKSDQASYYFQKEVSHIDLSSHGMVSWKWKVAQHPKNGDVRKRKTDDQAIQVLLAFEGKYIISYIWDPTAPVGYTKDSSIPFIIAQKVIVVQSGNNDLNKWFEIRRDVRADFKKLYGKEAPELRGIAVQINSQHTGTKCESFLSPIRFEKIAH